MASIWSNLPSRLPMSENPRERKSRSFAFNGFSVGCRSRATACGRLMKSRSTRRLALITYHYRSKDILWRAAAEHAFAKIRTEWDISAPEGSDLWCPGSEIRRRNMRVDRAQARQRLH